MNHTGKILKNAKRTALILTAFILALLVYLALIGLPGTSLKKPLAKFVPAGYTVEFQRLQYDWRFGIVLTDCAIYSRAMHDSPFLDAKRLAFFFNPFDWLRKEPGIRALQAHNTHLQIEIAQNGDQTACSVPVHNLSGQVRYHNNEWLLDLHCQIFTIPLNCRGAIRPNQAKPPANTPQSEPSAAKISPNIHAFLRQLEKLSFTDPPEIKINFRINLAEPERMQADIQMNGSQTVWNKHRIERWNFSAAITNGQAVLKQLSIRSHEQFLELSGLYTITNQTISAETHGQILPSEWLPCLPEAWQTNLNTYGLTNKGPLAFAMRVHPGRVDQCFKNMRGQISLAQTEITEILIERARLDFEISDGLLVIDPYYITLGAGRQRSLAQGNLTYDLIAGGYDGSCLAEIDPRILTPILNSNQAYFAEALEFKDKPLLLNADFTGQTGKDTAIWANGFVVGHNLLINSIPAVKAETFFEYAQGALTLTNILLVRAEGEARGWLADPATGTVMQLNFVSTANPAAILHMIDPEMNILPNDLQFDGNNWVSVQGRFDYGTGEATDLLAEIDGTDWNYPPLFIDQISCILKLRETTADLTDIRLEINDGTLQGRMLVYPAENSPAFRYAINANMQGIDLNDFLQMINHTNHEEYAGTLGAAGKIAGYFDNSRHDKINGAGTVRIEQGRLIQLRILGGLSRLIRLVDHNLGTINLTDFSADWTIRDDKIIIRNAILYGTTLAVHGEGQITLDGKLDFIVWLERSNTSRFLPAMERTTAIFSKLLAFRLTGSLAEPKWWPLNLSRDQISALPKDLLITLPKDVLIGLPQDLLIDLPKHVLVNLPEEILIKLPREIFINIPEALFIRLPKAIWQKVRPEQNNAVE